MRHHFLMSIYSFNILFRDRKVLINSIYFNNGYKITCYVKIHQRAIFFLCYFGNQFTVKVSTYSLWCKSNILHLAFLSPAFIVSHKRARKHRITITRICINEFSTWQRQTTTGKSNDITAHPRFFFGDAPLRSVYVEIVYTRHWHEIT